MKVDGKLRPDGGRPWSRRGRPAREGRIRRAVDLGVRSTTRSCPWSWRPSTPSGSSSARPSRWPSRVARCNGGLHRARPAGLPRRAVHARPGQPGQGAHRAAVLHALESSPRRGCASSSAAMRAIWSAWDDGTRLDFHGDFYSHTLMTPFFSPPALAVRTAGGVPGGGRRGDDRGGRRGRRRPAGARVHHRALPARGGRCRHSSRGLARGGAVARGRRDQHRWR